MSEDDKNQWILVVEVYRQDNYFEDCEWYVISANECNKMPEFESDAHSRFYDSWYDNEDDAIDAYYERVEDDF